MSAIPTLDPFDAYALWAASYPAHAHNPVMQAEQRAMLALLPPALHGQRVLDAGCGSGRYLLQALARGADHATGVDLSPQMLARAAQELETAERVGAPFVTVVLEDGSYSLIKLAQAGKKLDRYRVEFGPIDTVKMADACGVDGLRTTNPDELASAVKRAVERRRSLVIGVPVNDEDYRRLF